MWSIGRMQPKAVMPTSSSSTLRNWPTVNVNYVTKMYVHKIGVAILSDNTNCSTSGSFVPRPPVLWLLLLPQSSPLDALLLDSAGDVHHPESLTLPSKVWKFRMRPLTLPAGNFRVTCTLSNVLIGIWYIFVIHLVLLQTILVRQLLTSCEGLDRRESSFGQINFLIPSVPLLSDHYQTCHRSTYKASRLAITLDNPRYQLFSKQLSHVLQICPDSRRHLKDAWQWLAEVSLID